ncbi:MAG: phosphoribosylglycinamide formyltransferase [Aminobacteriaceae bacterium]
MRLTDPVSVAVLVSGSGSNLQALLDAQSAGELPSARISLVISDRAGVHALDRAKSAGVPPLVFDRRTLGLERMEREMSKALDERGIELLVLAGFLTILSPGFVKRFEGRMINVHPSLIPSFCGEGFYGLRVHEAALRRGVKLTGATVHLVNEDPDGGPILAQKAVRVLKGDTPRTLQRRVMEQAEWRLLPRTVESYCRVLCRQGGR